MKMKQLIAGVVTAGVLATGTAAVAGAATSSTTAPAAVSAAKSGKHHHGHLRHRMLRAGAKVAAATIGISTKDLVSEVRSGKSAAQVAQAHGVDPQTVVDAVVKAGDAKIDQLAKDGRITAERAAKLKDRLPGLVTKIVNRVPKAR
jgi:hypothetical protein